MCIRNANNDSGSATTGLKRKQFPFATGIVIGDFTIIKARKGKIIIATNEGEELFVTQKQFTDALEAFWQAHF
jgi:hypothetical protein